MHRTEGDGISTRPLLQQIAALQVGNAWCLSTWLAPLTKVIPLPCAMCAGVAWALKLHPTYLSLLCRHRHYLHRHCLRRRCLRRCRLRRRRLRHLRPRRLRPRRRRLRCLRHISASATVCVRPPSQLHLSPLSASPSLVSQPPSPPQPVPHPSPPAPPLSAPTLRSAALRGRCLRLRCRQPRLHPLR